MSVTRMVISGLVVGMLVGLVIPALAAGGDQSALWTAKVGILAPVSDGTNAGILLGVERELNSWQGSRSAIELDYAHPSEGGNGVDAWYLLYNMRYHVNGGGYLGWGAGLNETDASGPGNSDTTNFAYRVFYGQRWDRITAEVGWLSGLRDDNSGLTLSVGLRF